MNCKFQFYDSPIKSERTTHPYPQLERFNSMIVRLKVPPLRSGRFFCMGFNSMIVRLKGEWLYAVSR